MNVSTGVLPGQTLSALIQQEVIKASMPFDPGQIQPASLDLRLGSKAWRIQASFLPCLLYTSPSPRDPVSARMPSSA